MKKLVKNIAIIITIFIMFSCHEEGKILHQGNKSIIINDKSYKFVLIAPCEDCRGVWILVPEDATIEIPQTTSYKISCGKNCWKELECIWIKS